MSKSERITAPRGMPDALPSDMALVRHLESTARRVFALCAYEEIRTPLFEDTRLFVRGIGEATDIVEKEMYTFAEGESGDSITLRPEGTASVVRSVIEHELLKQKGFWKLYYIGCMFRKERPQAGRLRQFDQIGCEAVGSMEPVVDAESILLAARFFREVGLAGVAVKVNTIGCPACRAAFRDVLRAALAPRKAELCPDCQNRFDRNVFRILDCKVPACKAIALTAPPMREHLDADCKTHFDAVLDLLAKSGQEFKLDDHLVRGFDYYTRTVFELSHSSLGARDAVCGGGRYDNLVAELGGPPAGCVGFAVGVVPTILALQKTQSAAIPTPPAADLYLAAFSDDVRGELFRMAERLRGEGVSVEIDYERRSMKAQMRSANKLGARYAIVIGPDEIAGGEFRLKEMSTGAEQKVRVEAIAAAVRGIRA
jgi:histidyl-tRNA synthetase